jgi:ATP-dependent Clp protease ATP-binding subunit ClpA
MAEKSNKWVFLFDEIEKAHDKVYNILLSLLDDGTIQDNRGKTLDFKDSIFIFTSNKGVSDIKSKTMGFDGRGYTYEESKDSIVDSINKHFSPEFRNRIDEIIHFNSLSKNDVRSIIKLQLEAYPIEKTPQLIEHIVKNAYSAEYGAREINRFIKRTVGLEIANAFLTNKTPINSTYYTPSIVDGKISIVDAINLKKLAEVK